MRQQTTLIYYLTAPNLVLNSTMQQKFAKKTIRFILRLLRAIKNQALAQNLSQISFLQPDLRNLVFVLPNALKCFRGEAAIRQTRFF